MQNALQSVGGDGGCVGEGTADTQQDTSRRQNRDGQEQEFADLLRNRKGLSAETTLFLSHRHFLLSVFRLTGFSPYSNPTETPVSSAVHHALIRSRKTMKFIAEAGNVRADGRVVNQRLNYIRGNRNTFDAILDQFQHLLSVFETRG